MLWRALGRLLVAIVVVLSLAPVVIELPGEQGDKFGHALAYGALMGWFAQLHGVLRKRMALAIGFVALGVAVECAQAFVPARTFSAEDMAANALGVALGWLAAPPRVPDLLGWLERRWPAGKAQRPARSSNSRT